MRKLDWAGLIVLSICSATTSAFAQGTAFTYQGRLNDNGGPANGTYDLQFTVYDSAGGANVVAGPLAGSGVSVTNGLFTVSLDFGTSVFTGPARWLQIGVRTNNGGATFVPLNPRQALTPTPYAIFASTASNVVSGSVVKSINTLKDDVTLAAGANVTITPSGNTLTIAAPGGPVGGPWLLNGNSAYYNAGNVGIGTSTPNAPLYVVSQNAGIADNTATFFAPGIGPNASHVHYGTSGDWLIRSASGSGKVILQDSGGNVGIGTDNPTSRLEIAGQDALSLIGYQPLLTFHDSNAGYARSRIQSVDGGIALTTEAYISSGGANPGAGLLMLKNGSGNVGIGTANPSSKLEILAQDGLAITGFQPFLTLRDTSAGNARGIIASGSGDLGFYPNSSIGGSPAVIIKNSSGNVGIGTGTPADKLYIAGEAASGYAIGIEGNARQNRDKGGWVKAMAKVNADGFVARQYSAFGGPITAVYNNAYAVTFPFQVNDRFISVTPLANLSVFAVTASVRFEGPNTVSVVIFDPRDPSIAFDEAVANEFFIFVY